MLLLSIQAWMTKLYVSTGMSAEDNREKRLARARDWLPLGRRKVCHQLQTRNQLENIVLLSVCIFIICSTNLVSIMLS